MSFFRVFVLTVALSMACGSRASDPYGPCRTSSSCAEQSPTCINFRNRATASNVPLCTVPCEADADCPGNGVCVAILVGGYSRLCMERCVTSRDCPFAGGFCTDVSATGRACVP